MTFLHTRDQVPCVYDSISWLAGGVPISSLGHCQFTCRTFSVRVINEDFGLRSLRSCIPSSCCGGSTAAKSPCEPWLGHRLAREKGRRAQPPARKAAGRRLWGRTRECGAAQGSRPALHPPASRGRPLTRGNLLAGASEPSDRGQALTARRTRARG